MEIKYKSYNEVPQLSKKDLDYINTEDYLKEFFTYTPDLGALKLAMVGRDKHPVNRKLLHEVISESYKSASLSSQQKLNIDSLLSDGVYTVVTAHQPVLLGGPLYYIYKIASVINLARQINDKYPDNHVVPVFINGSEDHDFDEVDHFNIYNKKIQWAKEETGPVGRFSVEGLEEVINEAESILGESQFGGKLIDIFRQSLERATTYNDFVFSFVNRIFGDTGLLVVNMDNPKLKRNFIPILKKEILERKSEELVIATQKALEVKGFKPQAYPRDINLFYLGNGDRQRLTYSGGVYQIVGSDKEFTEEEVLREVELAPENFSPNVVLRPIYQEYTMPNLAYIGGGGEIAYWLERKAQFDYFETSYPMLIRRNSVLLLNKHNLKTLDGLGLDSNDLFDHEDRVIDRYLKAHITQDISISDELTAIEKAYKSISTKAGHYDASLEKSIIAEMTKQLKQVNNLGGRIKRSIKSKEETNVKKIRKVREKLFPDNGLQERKDNFIQYYADFGPEFIDFLIENLDPLDRRFLTVSI